MGNHSLFVGVLIYNMAANMVVHINDEHFMNNADILVLWFTQKEVVTIKVTQAKRNITIECNKPCNVFFSAVAIDARQMELLPASAVVIHTKVVLV